LYYHTIVLLKKACQSIADNNVLRILKNYKSAPSDAKQASKEKASAAASVDARNAAPASTPTWSGMSARLLARLHVADEATPEMQMPTPSAPAPSNRPKG
jgi:TusA-related sulfurtransferase